MMKHLLLIIMLSCTAVMAFCADFGLLTDQLFEADNTAAGYSSVFTPWFSWNGNNNLSLYLSGNLFLHYRKSIDSISDSSTDGWGSHVLIPEISRFALNYRRPGFSIAAGRIAYSDVLGLTASGFFDGLKFETKLSAGAISAAAMYTGLLYKESAKILMTAADTAGYVEPWDFDNLEKYFASKRLLAAFRWDMPIAEYHTFTFEALTQFDLNGADESLHSQYGAALVELYPQGRVGLIIGALFEAMENSSGEFSAALGGLARFKMDVPGALNDGINVIMQFGSGSWNDTFSAFTPITSSIQGKIFPYTISGLGMISADYTARLHRTVKAEAALRYFLRTYNDSDAEGYFYGGEIWTAVAWQPFNDLRVLFEGGAFFHGLGNIFSDSSGTLWKVRAGLVLSF